MNKNKLKIYTPPQAIVVEIDSIQVVCNSPKSGGNEDIVYEDFEL